MRHTSSSKKKKFQTKSKYLDYRKSSRQDTSDEIKECLDFDPKSRNKFDRSKALTFVPQINPESKNIKNDLNVSDKLYRDASTRKASKI